MFGPGEHAVPADIGKDDRRDTYVLEPAGEVEHRYVGLLRPALYRDATAPGVDGDGDSPGISFAGRANEIRIAKRRRSQDHPPDTPVQPIGGGRQRANAASQLHGYVDHIEDRSRRRRR